MGKFKTKMEYCSNKYSRKVKTIKMIHLTILKAIFNTRMCSMINKAIEISVICGVEVAVILTDLDKTIHTFSSFEATNPFSSLLLQRSIDKKEKELKILSYLKEDVRERKSLFFKSF